MNTEQAILSTSSKPENSSLWDRLSAAPRRTTIVLRHGVVPILFYLLAFCLLTFPLIRSFSTSFFAGQTDGLQNVWNIWWVNQAVHRPDLYPTIWYTNLLQWPFGTSLVGHTLNPFNGFLGAVLLPFLSLTATYNTILVFAFVMTGVTMYWLAYHLTRAVWPSLIAGFVLTFSSYHFAHYSQLQTASLEWIPLFLLCWYALVTRPRLLLGLAAGLALWLVLLCDYYSFVYCVLAAVIIFLWRVVSARSWGFMTRLRYLAPLSLFAVGTLLMTGSQVGSLLLSNHYDPLRGAHDAATYSLDFLAVLIPGGFWRFSTWTQGYWMRLPGNVTENSAFLPLSVLVLMGFLWVRRASLKPAVKQQLYLWTSVLATFFGLALGPVLHVAGNDIAQAKLMPYALLGRLLPFLNVSGVPARMAEMVIISAAILSAFALKELSAHFPQRRWAVAGLLGLMVFQMLPAPIVTTTVDVPPYVKVLASLPDGGVLDLLKTPAGFQLYYQTIHHKPISFGYLARLPSSVFAGDERLAAAYGSKDYAQLWGVFHVRYILTEQALSARADQPYMLVSLLYSSPHARIYRLACSCEQDVDHP